MTTLRDQTWWTDADRAELDLLAGEFLRVVNSHRNHCRVCKANGPWCQHLRDALDAVFQWRDLQRLRSKAVGLRATQSADAWLLMAKDAEPIARVAA